MDCLRRGRGATGVEYAIVVALIASVVVGLGFAARAIIVRSSDGVSGVLAGAATPVSDSGGGSGIAPAAPAPVDPAPVTVVAGQWTVTAGTGVQEGSRLTLLGGSGQPWEKRAFVTQPWPSSDVTILGSGTLTGTNANGYAIWFRVTRSGGSVASGNAFQVDPGYSGGAYILRAWLNNAETRPLAVKVVAGMNATQARSFSLIVRGDSLRAIVDGVVVLEVPSLSAALTSISYGGSPPSGSDVGVRCWGSSNGVIIDGLSRL